MSHEDLVIIKAFLSALKDLEHPLPAELTVIAEELPDSAYELYDVAERYEPLTHEYMEALQESSR
ncbi:MAG: hypothetical protein AAFQ89_24605 [Cyanobacteria bacterium J06626_18]